MNEFLVLLFKFMKNNSPNWFAVISCTYYVAREISGIFHFHIFASFDETELNTLKETNWFISFTYGTCNEDFL